MELFRAICVIGKLPNNRLYGKVKPDCLKSLVCGKFNLVVAYK